MSLYAKKAYGSAELYLYSFFTSALDGSKWSTSHLGLFTRGKIAVPFDWEAELAAEPV
jgi:hypothetical protein